MGEEFLNRLYKDMYKSEDVMYGIDERFIGNKTENIKNYLDKMESLHTRIVKHNHIDTLKEFYYKKYVIKEEDIPESYYGLQKRIYLEQGYGHIDFTREMKQGLVNEVITDQKRSLDKWIDYLISEDAKFYPFWAKYWVFQGMLKLGRYDKAKKQFTRRTNGTTTVFPEVNQEAISLSIDFLIKSLNKEKIADQELNILLENGSFEKIYTYIIKKLDSVKKEQFLSNDGKWIKYDQGSDHMLLVKSLEGRGTGWCTVGEKTAKTQLENGDFHVYYSYDSEGNPTIPRIAIRMEHGKIAEVRGVAKEQNLEPEMTEIVDKKLDEFPDKEEYKKKVSDMRRLTIIYDQYNNLTKEDLRFLYELDGKIEGFGYERDPRIREILKNRNIKKDLTYCCDCSEDEIAIEPEEIDGRKIVCYYGNLDLGDLENINGLRLPTIVTHGLNLSSLQSAEGLVLPEKVESLNLYYLENAKGLELPKYATNLYLNSLQSGEGLVFPKNVSVLELPSLQSAEGLVFPKNVTFLNLSSLQSTEGLVLPEKVETLYLNGLKNAKGLELPKYVTNLYLNSLRSAEGLVLPEKVESLDLYYLKNAKGLELPKYATNLYLNSLQSAEGLVLPENVETLYLNGLKNAKGLELPKYVTHLNLSSLQSAEGLVLPDNLVFLDLSSLTTVNGLQLPPNFNGKIYAPNIHNIEEYINKSNKSRI